MYPRRYYFSVFSMNLVSIIFCSIINLLSYRISFHSKIYTWMGKHLFEMYMYQRIPMWLLKYTVIYQNKYMYFVLSLLSTVLIAYVMHKINSKIDQKLNTLVRT